MAVGILQHGLLECWVNVIIRIVAVVDSHDDGLMSQPVGVPVVVEQWSNSAVRGAITRSSH